MAFPFTCHLKTGAILRVVLVACTAAGLMAGLAAPLVGQALPGQTAPGQTAPGQAGPEKTSAAPAASGDDMSGMAHMAGHMHLTELRPAQSGDSEKADAIVAAAREAMEPYKDYKKALAEGYKIFLPNVPQPQYHFTNYANAREAAQKFDPLKPTSLLYKKNADGGYTLVGAMYTDRVDASEEELNERIPLSVARWHQHVNFCKAPAGEGAQSFGPDAKFGMMGSISTREACEAAGGTFIPHVFGWMVHVYPYETDPKKVWSISDDDQGHDNMDRSAMPGMKMN
jgi:hypothetical protein